MKAPNTDRRKIASPREMIFSAAVIVLLLIVWLVLANAGGNGGTAVITRDGAVIARLPLDKDTVYRPDGIDMEFTVKSGEISVTHSDCPDSVCVKTGAISGGFESIVCLPNKVTVKIEKNDTDNIDVVI